MLHPGNMEGKNFILLCPLRSGSTWLMDTLNKHEKLTGHGELFLPEKKVWDIGPIDTPRYIEWCSERSTIAVRPFSTFSYLDRIVYNSPGAVGFKLKYGTLLKNPDILLYLRAHSISVVHLTRNPLDSIISWALVKTTGRAHPSISDETFDIPNVRFDPATLIQDLNWWQRNQSIARNLLAILRLPHIEVAYEDLLTDSNHFKAIWHFLAVNPIDDVPQSDFVETEKRAHIDMIANYREVRAAIEGTRFSALLR